MTDSGLKKSQKGKVKVWKNEYGIYEYEDGLVSDETTELQTVFKDGVLVKETSLSEIRDRLLKITKK